MSHTEFVNWSQSIRFTPSTRVDAASEEEVLDHVRSARAAGSTVRPVGSGHSSTPIFATEDALLSVDAMSGLIDHDAGAGIARVLPGTTLEDAGALLADVGLAMENLGDVDYQTIAGAIGTGTHGTGVTLGNLSSTLIGGRLVTGAGEVVPFGLDAEDAGPEGDGLLRAAQVSLGALGVMSSLTLRVVPLYEAHRRNWMSHVDWTMDHFDELAAQNRNMDFYWYPRSDETQIRTLNEPGAGSGPIPPGGVLASEEVGLGHEIITNTRDLRFNEMEYMLPLEGGMEFFAQVRQRVKDRHRSSVGWRVLVRTVAADSAMLSNCQGRDTMTIALLHNNQLPYEEYFSDMEPMLRDFGGRPHWGKKHSLTAAELAPLYPDWTAFADLRSRLDPDGVLMNEYLRLLWGAGEPQERDRLATVPLRGGKDR